MRCFLLVLRAFDLPVMWGGSVFLWYIWGREGVSQGKFFFLLFVIVVVDDGGGWG